jgi:SAM-dependent methyltransferase
MELEELIEGALAAGTLTGATLSKPARRSSELRKVTARPVELSEGVRYQLTYHRGNQATNENLTADEAAAKLVELMQGEFRQALVQTRDADFQVLSGKQTKILQRPPSKPAAELAHDRPKEHLLPENVPNPFLIELGVMTPGGKVQAARYGKFKQINRFVELVDDVAGELPRERPIRVVDFGSGKSYLTFALYQHLTEARGLEVDAVGLDVKEDVIRDCTELAARLGYEGLRFEVGEIERFDPGGAVDLVVSLHACDTATDDALAQAVRWDAQVILAVPCCQHELFAQMEAAGTLDPLLQHGVVKERFAALATDALRAKLLELAGYRAQIVEFVEMEHTPKNLMIRAVKTGRPQGDEEAYRALRDLLGVSPALERALA